MGVEGGSRILRTGKHGLGGRKRQAQEQGGLTGVHGRPTSVQEVGRQAPPTSATTAFRDSEGRNLAAGAARLRRARGRLGSEQEEREGGKGLPV